jgi:hypothetical protein
MLERQSVVEGQVPKQKLWVKKKENENYDAMAVILPERIVNSTM